MVDPISSMGAASVAYPGQVGGVTAPTTGTEATTGSGGFGELVTDGLQQVSNLEFTADAAVQDLATGGPTRIEDVMIATSQASLGIDMLARVRDRAVEAYQEIMRMPL